MIVILVKKKAGIIVASLCSVEDFEVGTMVLCMRQRRI